PCCPGWSRRSGPWCARSTWPPFRAAAQRRRSRSSLQEVESTAHVREGTGLECPCGLTAELWMSVRVGTVIVRVQFSGRGVMEKSHRPGQYVRCALGYGDRLHKRAAVIAPAVAAVAICSGSALAWSSDASSADSKA